MDRTKDVPEWAIARACELANQEAPLRWNPKKHHPAIWAHARYIAEHEEAPVDPMTIEARAALESMSWGVGGDNEGFIDRFIEALAKRGVTLTKEQQP